MRFSPRGISALASAALLVLAPPPAAALRVMTYNILNYSSGRDAQFRIVLEETSPDVLVVQEILSQAAVDNFLAQVLNFVDPGEWSAATFTNGPDTDNALFYRTARVDPLGHFDVVTALREIDEWRIRPKGYASSASELRIYSVHLKASQGSAEEAQRLAEVAQMRARMETFPAGENYVVLGDFNIYTSGEDPYQYMLSPSHGLAGVLVDPIGMPGNWHINPAFAAIHTQSPRTANFGGGATGGLDDRFDLILRGPALGDDEGLDLLEASYTPFGNDGQHFDVALIDPPLNGAVPQAVAQALHDGSDHLPVFADFQLPPIVVASASLDFGVVLAGAAPTRTLSVGNGAILPADELSYTLAAPAGFTAPGGAFAAAAGAPANLHAIGMETDTAGPRAGNLTVSSDDLDHPAKTAALAGEVWNHAAPSVAAASVETEGLLDFGAHDPGGFTDRTAFAHNVGFGPFQAPLDVHDAELEGDARFTIVGGFESQQVGGTPGEWTVRFDDAGAALGAHAGTLTFHTRDPQALEGASALADLVYALAAFVTDGAVGAPLASAGPTRVGFVALGPNPAAGAVSIRFGVARTGAVTLRVYDVAGRLVRTLVDGAFDRGDHTFSWDGRDDSRRTLGGGIYFARLVIDGAGETRKIIRMK